MTAEVAADGQSIGGFRWDCLNVDGPLPGEVASLDLARAASLEYMDGGCAVTLTVIGKTENVIGSVTVARLSTGTWVGVSRRVDAEEAVIFEGLTGGVPGGD